LWFSHLGCITWNLNLSLIEPEFIDINNINSLWWHLQNFPKISNAWWTVRLQLCYKEFKIIWLCYPEIQLLKSLRKEDTEILSYRKEHMLFFKVYYRVEDIFHLSELSSLFSVVVHLTGDCTMRKAAASIQILRLLEVFLSILNFSVCCVFIHTSVCYYR
jgi:hypothetical protein